MSEWLGNIGLGWITLLPLPLAILAFFMVGLGTVVLVTVVWGFFAVCFGSMLVLAALDRATASNVSVEISEHLWSRSVEVEELVEEEDEDWCDDLPDNADVIERWEEFHHREKRIGPDRDIYEDRCRYTVLEWDVVDTKENAGTGTRIGAWPKVKNDRCKRVGCARPGDKEEKLELELTPLSGSDGPWTCDMETETEWTSWGQGQRAELLVGGVIGIDYCDTLTAIGAKPKPSPQPKPKPRKGKGKRRKR